MKFQEGYVYHINDEYFAKVQEDKLMQNKENGTYRPTVKSPEQCERGTFHKT